MDRIASCCFGLPSPCEDREGRVGTRAFDISPGVTYNSVWLTKIDGRRSNQGDHSLRTTCRERDLQQRTTLTISEPIGLGLDQLAEFSRKETKP
jgi:hypothetical protein